MVWTRSHKTFSGWILLHNKEASKIVIRILPYICMAVNSLQSAFCHPMCSSQNLSEILVILVYWWGQWCSESVQNETKCTWLMDTGESMVWTQTGLGLNHQSPTYQLCDLGQVFNLSELQCSYLQNGGWWYLSIGFLKWLDKKQDHIQQTFSMFSQI